MAKRGSVFDVTYQDADQEFYDLVIIGGGPAGAAAALYGARGKLKTLVIDKAPNSGALAITHKIANYPGVPGEMTGLELLEQMRWQAADFGAAFVHAPVQGVYVEGDTKEVFTPEAVYRGKALVVATGAMDRGKKMPGEEGFEGRGVSYCATCDAAFYQGQEVSVLGDSEEALEEALVLTKFASRVHLVVPGKQLRGVPEGEELPERPNLEYHFQTKPLEIVGDGRVAGVVVKATDGAQRTLSATGVFLYLSGAKPSTEFLRGALPLTQEGYLVAGEMMETPAAGVFAAGDVRRSPVKQAVIAAADGALAAMAADRFVNNRPKLIAQR